MKALKIQIRTKKEDSAMLYHTLEAYEGLTSYRTLPHREGEQFRDVELSYAPNSHQDVMEWIEETRKIIGIEFAPSRE